MDEQAIKQNILDVAGAFAAATKRSLATVSTMVYGNQAFLAGLSDPKQSVTIRKVNEMMQRFSDEWPSGVPWPPMRPVNMRRPRRGKKSVKSQ